MSTTATAPEARRETQLDGGNGLPSLNAPSGVPPAAVTRHVDATSRDDAAFTQAWRALPAHARGGDAFVAEEPRKEEK